MKEKEKCTQKATGNMEEYKKLRKFKDKVYLVCIVILLLVFAGMLLIGAMR